MSGGGKFQAPRGTLDQLPGEAAARARIYMAMADLAARRGYELIATPAFEDTELFSRGVGGSTDIVQKEMFTFSDQGGRSLTLRPEGTAPVVRAYIEHGMHKLPQPVKLWYWGPFFRHERPQAGRYRQFHQAGAELIGSDSPLVDAEAIIYLDQLLRGLGLGSEGKGLRLRLGSLGSPASRASYRGLLVEYLNTHRAGLSPEVVARIDTNPLRAFDSDDPGTREVMAGAPVMLDHLDDADAAHFAEVRALLDAADVEYELDAALVRGLDYYTRTVFEFTCDSLGAQSGVAGGGRYDGLVELLGGPPTPAIGWAAGIERILLALGTEPEESSVDVFVVAADERRAEAFAIVEKIRAAGNSADLDLAGRGFKGQMKQSGRSGAKLAVILAEDGTARIRDIAGGGDDESADGSVGDIAAAVSARL